MSASVSVESAHAMSIWYLVQTKLLLKGGGGGGGGGGGKNGLCCSYPQIGLCLCCLEVI